MVSEIVAEFFASVSAITGILSLLIPILFFNKETERFVDGLTSTYIASIPVLELDDFMRRLSDEKSNLINDTMDIKNEDERVKSNSSLLNTTIVVTTIIFIVLTSVAALLYKFVGFPLLPFLFKLVFVSLGAITIELTFMYNIIGNIRPVNMNAINTSIADYSYKKTEFIRNYWNRKK